MFGLWLFSRFTPPLNAFIFKQRRVKKHLKVQYLSNEKGNLACHNANGYLVMFLTSCEVCFCIFILVCLETTICVMYVSTYSLCLIYFYGMKIRNTGIIKLIMYLYYMFYYLNCFITNN